MTLQQEILENSGIEPDLVYLEEGIRFFKNSTKMDKLAKKLSKKHEKLVKKSDMENAKALQSLVQEINKVSDKFKQVEEKFKQAKGKENKKAIKSEYARLEKDFKKLVDVAKKDATKRALIAAGGIAIVVAILAAGIFGFTSLGQTTLEGAATNLDARASKIGLARTTRTTGSDGIVDVVGKTGTRIVGNVTYDTVIKSTNKDLVQAATVAGATGAGVLGAGVIQKLRKMGQNNKTIAQTVAAIEDLKSAEKKKSVEKSDEGDQAEA